MNDLVRDAADQAAELLPFALTTLRDLMMSDDQPGPVRVAAAKATVDYALKLSEKREADAGTLAKLDAVLDEFRAGVGLDPL